MPPVGASCGGDLGSPEPFRGDSGPRLSLGPQIEKLLQQAADKEKEPLALLKLTPIKIWNTDLNRFLEEWEVSGGVRPTCICTQFLLPDYSRHATESMLRVGGQGCGLEQQESRVETSDAQDTEIYWL